MNESLFFKVKVSDLSLLDHLPKEFSLCLIWCPWLVKYYDTRELVDVRVNWSEHSRYLKKKKKSSPCYKVLLAENGETNQSLGRPFLLELLFLKWHGFIYIGNQNELSVPYNSNHFEKCFFGHIPLRYPAGKRLKTSGVKKSICLSCHLTEFCTKIQHLKKK